MYFSFDRRGNGVFFLPTFSFVLSLNTL
jgi:hypothetical protein